MTSSFQFDGKDILTLLENEEWTEDWDNDCYEIRGVFLGTVFGLTPSGKYYAPFACSNVEVCEACLNSLALPCDDSSPCVHHSNTLNVISGLEMIPYECRYHCEACQDAQWWQDAESVADAHGFYLMSGEGDPCDIFAAQSREKDAAKFGYKRFVFDDGEEIDWEGPSWYVPTQRHTKQSGSWIRWVPVGDDAEDPEASWFDTPEG